jgi:hypothetical protein
VPLAPVPISDVCAAEAGHPRYRLRAASRELRAARQRATEADVTALAFNAVWHYARSHRGCSAKPLTLPARSHRQALSALPSPWRASRALVGVLLPVLDVAVIAAFSASYCIPIPGESPGPPNLNSGARYHEDLPLIPGHA